MAYQDHIIEMDQLVRSKKGPWDGIHAESVARMRLQNRFKTGLEIARYTADIMRRDMAAYDADSVASTPSRSACWHGFVAQQKHHLDQEALSARPSAEIHLSLGLDGRRAALSSSGRCPISRCTRRLRSRP